MPNAAILSNNTGAPGSGKAGFADPYIMYSSYAMPKNMEDVLRLAEFTWLNCPQYSTALKRAGSYFLTEVEFSDVDGDEKENYEKFFSDRLRIKTQLELVSNDLLCYGNSFTSVYLPFIRTVSCVKCRVRRGIDMIKSEDISLDARAKKFKIYCPMCKNTRLHDHTDINNADETKIHIIRWDPHEIQIRNNFITGENVYVWNIEHSIKNRIIRGDGFWLKNMPWEYILAALKGMSFKFNKGVIFHAKEPAISGVKHRGWGIPKVMASFRDSFYVQTLKRQNEALAMDYITPFRYLSPKATPNVDPFLNHDVGQWRTEVQNMIESHRKDPAGWHFAPFPVEYQSLSGEGQEQSPWELIKQGNSDLLDGLGIPMELFQGTLALQAAPTALRLFESTWFTFVSQLNEWLDWVAGKVGNVFHWAPATASLKPVSFADNLERNSMLLQLAASQQVSKQTSFAPLGLNAEDEIRKMMEENRKQLEVQEEFDEDQRKKQELKDMGGQEQGGGGGAAAGGDPLGAALGGQVGTTPGDQQAQAAEIANQILGSPTRRSDLIAIGKASEPLHAMVLQEIKKIEQQGAYQGVLQTRGQV